MSRSNKEARETKLGTGGLEQARKGMSGRGRKMMDAEEEAMSGPKPKKKKKAADEESE